MTQSNQIRCIETWRILFRCSFSDGFFFQLLWPFHNLCTALNKANNAAASFPSRLYSAHVAQSVGSIIQHAVRVFIKNLGHRCVMFSTRRNENNCIQLKRCLTPRPLFNNVWGTNNKFISDKSFFFLLVYVDDSWELGFAVEM